MSDKSNEFDAILKSVKSQREEDQKNNVPFDIYAARPFYEGFNDLIATLESPRSDIKVAISSIADIDSIYAEALKPTNRTILSLHAGGYVLGLKQFSNMYRYYSSEISAACEANVWVIDYRIAPENPYPASLEDAYKAYLAILESGVNAKDIFLMGDSAGGGMALALLIKLRDDGKPLPKAAVTISAWTDLSGTADSYVSRSNLDLIWNGTLANSMADLVVSKDKIKEPYISPLYGSLAGLPPLFMLVGNNEILYDDSVRFAEKAKQAGVDVTLDITEGMSHIYPLFGGIYKEGEEAIERIGQFVRNHAS